MLKKPSLIPTFYILSLYRHPEGSPFDFFSSLSQGTKSCFCPNPTPRSPPSKVSGRGEEPLKFPEKPERTRRGRLKNPQMNPQKSPRRPEGKAISSPIWNPPNRTPRNPDRKAQNPRIPILTFCTLSFPFHFYIFLDWNPYQNPRTPRTLKLPQRPGGELVWLLSCNHFTSKNPRYPFRTRSPKEIFSTLFLFFTLHRCFPGDHSRPKDPSWPPDFVLGLVYESATNTQ